MSGSGVPFSTLLGQGLGWNAAANGGDGQVYIKLGSGLIFDASGNIIPTVNGSGNAIAIATPSSAIAGAAQTISGTYTGNAPSGFSYAIDGGTPATAATPTIGNGAWSFAITAPGAGPHSITVTGLGANTGSTTSAVFTNSAANSLTVTTPASGTAAGTALTISGTYSGAAPTGFSYALDGGGAAVAPSPAIAGGAWSFQITAPSAGSHTIAVTAVGSSAAAVTSGAFSTVAAGSPTITVGTPASAIAGAAMTISGTYTNGVPTGFSYRIDGGSTVAAAGATISGGNWSFPITAPAAGTHYISVYGAGANTASATSGSFTTATANSADGSALAPAGTAQYPSALSGYKVRPPWSVAGVDYPVGYPAGTALQDWQTLSGTGISVNTTASPPTVTLSGLTGYTVNAVDFSLHGGATLVILGCTNTTVQNCNFGGSNITSGSTGVIFTDSASSGFTLEYTVMDGGGPGSMACFVFAENVGDITLKYNWFKHFPSRVLQVVGTIANLTYQFNLEGDGPYNSAAHLNFLEWDGPGVGATGNTTITYNFILQNTAVAANGEGYQFVSNNGSAAAAINNVDCSNNVFVSTGTAANGTAPAISYFIHGAPIGTPSVGTTVITGTATCNNNYFDLTEAYGAFYGTTLATWAASGNIDMTTGTALSPGGPTLAISAISPLVAGTTATITGTFAGGAPTGLAATVDGATIALSGVSITTSAGSGSGATGTFSAQFTASAAGGHTMVVSGVGTYAGSSGNYQFTTSSGSAPAITVNTPAAAIAGSTMTISGTYANGTPTGFSYRIDGAAAVTASGPTISGGTWSFPVTAPAAGTTHTISVSAQGPNTASATSGQFTTTASNALTVATVAQNLVAGATMTVQGTYVGAVPSGLTYEFDSAGATAVTSPTIGGGSYSFSATVPAAGSHTVTVTGTGSNTASATSNSFTTVASIVAPGAPTGIAAGSVTSSSVALTWTAPSSGTSPFTYTVQHSPHGANTWTTASSSITGTGYTVTGLTAATDYDFQVAATNSAGTGTYDTLSGGTTTAAAPSDGYSGAPSGTAQLPNALSSYGTNRPSWHVAGVDYAVGIPSGTTLTDWQAMTGTGITVVSAASPPYVRIDSTANVVVDSVDFSLHGGASLFFIGSAAGTVQNCNFGGTNAPSMSNSFVSSDTNSPGLTVKNCAFAGSGGSFGGIGCVYAQGGGTVLVEYCLLSGAPASALVSTNNSTNSGTVTAQYNLIEGSAAFHSNGGANVWDLQFNTLVTQTAQAYYAVELTGGGTVSTGSALNNNTLVAALSGSEGYFFHVAPFTSGSGQFENNYVDPTGAYGLSYGTGSFAGWTVSGNINLATGAAITPP